MGWGQVGYRYHFFYDKDGGMVTTNKQFPLYFQGQAFMWPIQWLYTGLSCTYCLHSPASNGNSSRLVHWCKLFCSITPWEINPKGESCLTWQNGPGLGRYWANFLVTMLQDENIFYFTVFLFNSTSNSCKLHTSVFITTINKLKTSK